jgi:hypothetical protein
MKNFLLVLGLMFTLISLSATPARGQAVNGATIQDYQTNLTLSSGSSFYLYGMVTGGLYSSTGFAQGEYQSVTDADGNLSAALATTTGDSNSFTTNAEYYVIGGIGISGASSMTSSYGANTQAGASQVSDTFKVTQNSLVVFVGLASSQQSISLSGIQNLTTDAISSGPSAILAMIIGHAFLSPGTYTATENSAALAAGQDPNNMADLIGVFIFNSSSYILAPTLVGQGTVTSADGRINCTRGGGGLSGTCSATYLSGTEVTLSATPASNWTFSGWSGFCSGVNPCSLVLDQNLSPTASFTAGLPLAATPASQVAALSASVPLIISIGWGINYAGSAGGFSGSVTLTAGCVRGLSLAFQGSSASCSDSLAATITVQQPTAEVTLNVTPDSYASANQPIVFRVCGASIGTSEYCILPSPQVVTDLLTSIQSSVTFNSLAVTSDTGICPLLTQGSQCFTIQQNFYVFEPNQTAPSYWVQNILLFANHKSGWEVAPIYQIWEVNPSNLEVTGPTDCSYSDPCIPGAIYILVTNWTPISATPFTVSSVSTLSSPKSGVVQFLDALGNSGLPMLQSTTTLPANSFISAGPYAPPTQTVEEPTSYEPQVALVSFPGVGNAVTIVTFGSSTSGNLSSFLVLAYAGGFSTVQAPFETPCSSTNEESTNLYWSLDGSTFGPSQLYEGEGVTFAPSTEQGSDCPTP